MPLFEYKCLKKNLYICENFEKLVFGDEEKKVRCPTCGGKVKKVMSVFNFEVNGFNADNGYGRKRE